MTKLFIEDAVAGVRTRIDELAERESDMFTIPEDDRNLTATIKNILPEAIENVHLSAPVSLLEGLSKDIEDNTPDDFDGHLDIEINDVEVLRLVSFKAEGSKITLFNAVSEDSALGRMQTNEFLHGTYKAPVLVEMSDSTNHHPHYTYYGANSFNDTESVKIIYIPFEDAPNTDEESNKPYYNVCSKIYNTLLDYLTGMVLAVYSNNDAAKYFLDKAASELEK